MTEQVLVDLERLAREVDRLADTVTDEESAATASAKRMRLLIELDVSGLLEGTGDVERTVASYSTLRGYHEAAVTMASYLGSAARIQTVAAPIPLRVIDALVSLDWFRKPTPFRPPNVTVHEWLALCERNFRDPMPTGAGMRFVRLHGNMHVLHFRLEVGPQPKLWRVEPA